MMHSDAAGQVLFWGRDSPPGKRASGCFRVQCSSDYKEFACDRSLVDAWLSIERINIFCLTLLCP